MNYSDFFKDNNLNPKSHLDGDETCELGIHKFHVITCTNDS